MAVPVCFPPIQEGSPFSTSSPASVVSYIVGFSCSDWCEVVSPGSFDLHFPDDKRYWVSFHVCWPSGCLLWKNVYSCLLLIFNWIIYFWRCWVWLSSLYILDTNSLPARSFGNIFSHSVGCHSVLWLFLFFINLFFTAVQFANI